MKVANSATPTDWAAPSEISRRSLSTTAARVGSTHQAAAGPAMPPVKVTAMAAETLQTQSNTWRIGHSSRDSRMTASAPGTAMAISAARISSEAGNSRKPIRASKANAAQPRCQATGNNRSPAAPAGTCELR